MTDSGDGASSKNFRSAYYERVGFFCVPDKKLIETLSASPLDIEKLIDFCLRCDLGRHRECIWRLLLSVECHLENVDTSNIRRIHDDHFEQLNRSLGIILKALYCKQNNFVGINGSTSESINVASPDTSNTMNPKQQQSSDSTVRNNLHLSMMQVEQNRSTNLTGNCLTAESLKDHPGEQVVLMYLIEVGELCMSDLQTHFTSTTGRVMVSMASVFVKTSSNLNSAYFLFRNFFKKIKQHQDTLRQLYEKSLVSISHDMPDLDKHIRSICNYDQLPCWYWFNYCFIDLLDERSLVRMWDRVVGGCLGFISKLMRAILVELEPHLMISQTSQDLVKLLTSPLKKDESECLFSSVVSNEIK